MTSRFTEFAIDCADPDGLAWFWCSVLGHGVQDEDDEVVTTGSLWCQEARTDLASATDVDVCARARSNGADPG